MPIAKGAIFYQSGDGFSYIDTNDYTLFNRLLSELDIDSFVLGFYEGDACSGAVIVNIQTGFIETTSPTIDNIKAPEGYTNFRFISFRRVGLEMNMINGLKELPIDYFVGWQANDKDGKNRKRLIEIHDGKISKIINE